MLHYIRNLLLLSPFLEADDTHIGFIGISPVSYSIDTSPGSVIIKKYLNGDTLRKFAFTLTSRSPATSDSIRAENNRNFEQLSIWLDQIVKKRLMPPMESGYVPQKISAVSSAFMLSRDDNGECALYQMQCELIYFSHAI